MVRGNHDIRMGGSIRANQLNTVAVGFPNGFWVVSGAWTGDPAADLLTGSAQPGDPRSGVRRRKYRPPLETVPSIRRGQLAGEQEFDVEPRFGLGAGDARSAKWPIASRISIPPLDSSWSRARMPGRKRRHSRWIGPRWSRASAWPGNRSAAAIPWFAAAMRSSTIRPGIRARRGCGRIRPTTPNRMRLLSCRPLARSPRLPAPNMD